MAVATIVVLAFLAHKGVKHAKASPISGYDRHECTPFTLPVPVTSHNGIYDIVPVNSNIDASAFVVDSDTWDTKSAAERLLKNITISKTFNIHANLCVPHNGGKKEHLQIATHGGGFDSRYWDVTVDPKEHSYVAAALDAGYSILTYDRLGTGKSDKADAYTEVQPPAELEILRSITDIARAGYLFKHLPASARKEHIEFDKFIHVGHSYGSLLTLGLTSKYPELSDAAVFTGLIPTGTQSHQKWAVFGWEYALENDPVLFADSKPGYLVQGTKNALQTCFFHALQNSSSPIGGFEPELFDYAHSIRQTVTVIEAFLQQLITIDPSRYKGPVQFMLAEFDFLICTGDCNDAYDVEKLNHLFKNAADIDVYIQNGTGHGLPFHNGARKGFEATLAWLDRNGL